jgi:hypothetical protein
MNVTSWLAGVLSESLGASGGGSSVTSRIRFPTTSRDDVPFRKRRPVHSWHVVLVSLSLSAAAVACASVQDARPARLSPAWQHDWARGAVFNEVFVRSFANSNGDGVGDLAGLTARLDYLNDGDSTTTTGATRC